MLEALPEALLMLQVGQATKVPEMPVLTAALALMPKVAAAVVEVQVAAGLLALTVQVETELLVLVLLAALAERATAGTLLPGQAALLVMMLTAAVAVVVVTPALLELMVVLLAAVVVAVVLPVAMLVLVVVGKSATLTQFQGQQLIPRLARLLDKVPLLSAQHNITNHIRLLVH
jgi:hypothetical protein